VLLERFTAADRAANIPEFVNARPDAIKRIREQFVDDYSYARAGDASRFRGDLEGAARSYRKAIEADPNKVAYRINLGIILSEMGILEEAKVHFATAIKLAPNHRDGHNNLGSLLARQGKLEEAIVHYREAVRIDPQYFQARLSLGASLLDLGELEEASHHLSVAVQLSPSDPLVRYRLGIALHRQGKLDEAANHYGLALEQDPNCVMALLALAAIRVRAEDPRLRNAEQAVELASKACTLTGYQDPTVLDILAGVYAAVGRFADATATAQRALALARSTGNEDLVNSLERKLDRYRRQQAPEGSKSP
jgi:tetratricopeptide (TPR) repeat protein